MAKKHLKGLNTLRFFAATLVLIDHGRHHLNEMNIGFGQNIPILHKGIVSVNFFFTLSGFLISYLALNEIKREGSINYRFFYIRRVLRIMPLYYLVLAISLLLIGVIAPIFLNENKLGFPILEGGLLYIFMIPNMVKALWVDTVGGLNILWSIGVEEQYYLLFPLIMFVLGSTQKKISIMLIIFSTYFIFYWSVQSGFFDFNSVLLTFFGSLKFHYMLMGIVFSLICHNYQDTKMFKSVINNNTVQLVVFLLALLEISIFFKTTNIANDLISTIIFASLIVVVSHRSSGRFFNINIKFLSYFGVISYGIYLLHPLVSYFLRFLIVKVDFINKVISFAPICYIILLLIITIVVAYFSYNYYELKFLRLKKKFLS